ncbi:MAG: hypothetical protein HY843_07510 [Bdellovibrio sp.]|nr:hypothetical protein [Bdellovibrio sp.]
MQLNPKAAEWFIKIGNRSTGPYTTEEVHALFNAGDIQPFHKLTSTSIKNEWVIAKDLITAYEHLKEEEKKLQKQKNSTSENITHPQFKAPHRPVDIDKVRELKPKFEPGYDATLSLFDTLQAVKEKKIQMRATTPQKEAAHKGLLGFLNNYFPAQIWMILGLCFCLILLSLGVIKLIDKTLKPIASPVQPPAPVQMPIKEMQPYHPKPVIIPQQPIKPIPQPYRPPQPAIIKPPPPPEEQRQDDQYQDPRDQQKEYPENQYPPDQNTQPENTQNTQQYQQSNQPNQLNQGQPPPDQNQGGNNPY